MNDHRPTADPGPGFALPPGLRFPYAIGRPGPDESTGPRAGLLRGGGEGASVRRTPPRGLPGSRPGSSRTRAVDSVAAAFLAGEPRPGAVPRGARRAWFDVPAPRHR
ncbi:hypothetical protein SAMN05421803_10999 [Nocardiopsis flavescens]|uniref:Uncharacterized protein n=1 Tax=Nocardiopsis flavescens TaxID=758803 RepID=A0A1M6LXV5_9ACTN|nr:hypothetical protein [Nocardiopsis flavescens]SHJ75933.1 hypothetical protein SAMN05421803_10999 [Nocardiopsis flavescens]